MNLPVKDGAHLRPSRRPTLSYKVGLLSDECVLAEEGERKVRGTVQQWLWRSKSVGEADEHELLPLPQRVRHG